LAYDWHPRAERMGLQYHACVYSTSTFSQLSTEKAIRLMKNSLVLGFDSEILAENWLKSF
jgi:hypothetical protein